MDDKSEDYETARQRNIAHNQALIRELGLEPLRKVAPVRKPPRKRTKVAATPNPPTRASARIANQPAPKLQIPSPSPSPPPPTNRSRIKSGAPAKAKSASRNGSGPITSLLSTTPKANVDEIVRGWNTWTPTGPEPTQEEDGVLSFADYPEFRPNKPPAEILREGAFGGSYFRPLYSKRLGITVEGDWEELPAEWIAGVDVKRYLTSTAYDPEINKAGVACGQSIEEWEANGWIMHAYDVRGWFQWYCRFYQGRRCEDDERQIGRWMRCVGPRGRWKRTLLKQYLRKGVRHVMDEEGGEGGEGGEVSPVITQTCLHWAYEVRQGDLDDVWAFGL